MAVDHDTYMQLSAENERLRVENADLRDFHDMVINWPHRDAKTCFEIMGRCKKYETAGGNGGE